MPPPGFAVSGRGSGIQHDSLLAAIQVVQLPANAWDELGSGLTRAALERAGMFVSDSSAFTLRGAPALRVSLTQMQGGTEYGKEMLVTRDSANTFMVVASWEIGTPVDVVAAMREAVLTLGVVASASDDPFDGLVFRADLPPELPVWKRLGPTLALSESGTVPAPDGEALVVLALGNSAIALVGDREAWMTQVTRQLPGLRDLSGIAVRTIEADGEEAYELTASAIDTSSETPLLVHTVAIPYGLSTIVMTARVGRDRSGDFLPAFRRLAASLRVTVDPE